jgi:predicted TIM-barrel fold metal-dependent hydrolase
MSNTNGSSTGGTAGKATGTAGITAGVGLIDHHCHGLAVGELDAHGFRSLATESDWLSEPGLETLDSPFGLAIRALCAPILGLERHVSIDHYIERRRELGATEVNTRLMTSAGHERLLLDTGLSATPIMAPLEMTAALGTVTNEIVRLESVAESLAGSTTAARFAADFATALSERNVDAVGFKSVIAYRTGLDVPAVPPTPTEVRVAAADWLTEAQRSGNPRITNGVLLAHLIWEAVRLGKPLQFHVGFGDSDVQLYRSDPSRLTRFFAATRTSGTKMMLLHCYPFIREAASLANIFPHVYYDVGEVSHYLGPSARAAIRQSYELAPFHKVLYSSDAYGLPEHYAVSAAAWRRETGMLVDEWLADDWLSVKDAEQIVHNVAAGNARRVYGLDEGS